MRPGPHVNPVRGARRAPGLRLGGSRARARGVAQLVQAAEAKVDPAARGGRRGGRRGRGLRRARGRRPAARRLHARARISGRNRYAIMPRVMPACAGAASGAHTTQSPAEGERARAWPAALALAAARRSASSRRALSHSAAARSAASRASAPRCRAAAAASRSARRASTPAAAAAACAAAASACTCAASDVSAQRWTCTVADRRGGAVSAADAASACTYTTAHAGPRLRGARGGGGGGALALLPRALGGLPLLPGGLQARVQRGARGAQPRAVPLRARLLRRHRPLADLQ